jgi:hypothetical protein
MNNERSVDEIVPDACTVATVCVVPSIIDNISQRKACTNRYHVKFMLLYN